MLSAFRNPRTMFARMWRALLLILLVTFLVHAILVMKSLQLGAEAQTERRLSRIGEYWSQQKPLVEPLGLDPVTVIYPSYEQLPPNIRQMLPSRARGILELGNSKEDYFALAQERPSGAVFYVVEFHYEVKPNEGIEHEVFIWYLLGMIPLALLLAWICKRIAARVTAPMHELGRLVVARNPASLDPVPLPEGASLELEALVERLNDALQRTADVLERERSFTQFASHELRTPAAVIKAALERFESQATPEQQRPLARANRGLRDMEALIDTFLQLSRDQVGSHENCWTTVDADWVAALYSHVTAGSPERELSVEVRGPLVLEASETLVHVLMANMLKNALFHGGPGPINVVIDSHAVEVRNALPSHPAPQGYGLGTQIAHRICARFQWQFNLTINDEVAVARVSCGD